MTFYKFASKKIIIFDYRAKFTFHILSKTEYISSFV